MTSKEMTNKQALEIVYRKSCLPQKQPPQECSVCAMGQDGKCEIYQAYLQLTKILDMLEILKSHAKLTELNSVYLGYPKIMVIAIDEKDDDYETVKRWLEYEN